MAGQKRKGMQLAAEVNDTCHSNRQRNLVLKMCDGMNRKLNKGLSAVEENKSRLVCCPERRLGLYQTDDGS